MNEWQSMVEKNKHNITNDIEMYITTLHIISEKQSNIAANEREDVLRVNEIWREYGRVTIFIQSW